MMNILPDEIAASRENKVTFGGRRSRPSARPRLQSFFSNVCSGQALYVSIMRLWHTYNSNRACTEHALDLSYVQGTPCMYFKGIILYHLHRKLGGHDGGEDEHAAQHQLVLRPRPSEQGTTYNFHLKAKARIWP